LVLNIPFGGECWSKAQPYRVQKQSSLCALMKVPLYGAMSSHYTNPDYFNHRALGIRPRSLLWLAHVTGLFKKPPPTYRMDSELRDKKQKSPLLLLPVIRSFFKASGA